MATSPALTVSPASVDGVESPQPERALLTVRRLRAHADFAPRYYRAGADGFVTIEGAADSLLSRHNPAAWNDSVAACQLALRHAIENERELTDAERDDAVAHGVAPPDSMIPSRRLRRAVKLYAALRMRIVGLLAAVEAIFVGGVCNQSTKAPHQARRHGRYRAPLGHQ